MVRLEPRRRLLRQLSHLLGLESFEHGRLELLVDLLEEGGFSELLDRYSFFRVDLQAPVHDIL